LNHPKGTYHDVSRAHLQEWENDLVEHVMAHPDGCECQRCRILVEIRSALADEPADEHPIHHHHIDNTDELEHAETELAWEELKP